jgi:hypothetical protein
MPTDGSPVPLGLGRFAFSGTLGVQYVTIGDSKAPVRLVGRWSAAQSGYRAMLPPFQQA